MVDWLESLDIMLDLASAATTGAQRFELSNEDRERLDEAKSILARAVERLAQASTTAEHERATATIEMLREVLRQGEYLDDIHTRDALLGVARQVGDTALRVALEAAAATLGGTA